MCRRRGAAVQPPGAVAPVRQARAKSTIRRPVERDPEIAGLHARLHAGNVRPFSAAIEAAKRQGELIEDRDQDTMVAALIGPLFYRRWFSKEAIDDAFVARVVAQALL